MVLPTGLYMLMMLKLYGMNKGENNMNNMIAMGGATSVALFSTKEREVDA